jgi:hypothetical protein
MVEVFWIGLVSQRGSLKHIFLVTRNLNGGIRLSFLIAEWGQLILIVCLLRWFIVIVMNAVRRAYVNWKVMIDLTSVDTPLLLLYFQDLCFEKLVYEYLIREILSVVR